MTTASASDLVEELPVLQRLALAYAPAPVRLPTLALFALDTRLAAILRAAREPMLAQLRLAWWREQLKADVATWPEGEPLLASLRSWEGRLPVLAALVDGWEAMTGAAPLPADALLALAEARGRAFAALADLAGVAEQAVVAGETGTAWALADLANRLTHPDERRLALDLAQARVPSRSRLSCRLRPLTVLHGLALRSPGQDRSAPAITSWLAALRLGLLGR